MEDNEKTKEQIMNKLAKLRQQITKLKETEIKRKKTEEGLKKSQQEFASLFKNSPEALVYTDEKGNILDTNPCFSALFGYTLEEIKGRNIDNGMITAPDKMKEAKKLTSKALKEDFYFETMRKKKNGTLFPVTISGSRVIIGGQFKGFIASYRDITERQKMIDDLKNSEEKYRSLYENMPGVYYRADREGNILIVNPPGVTLLGYSSPEEIIGKNMAKDLYYIPEDRKIFLEELKKREGIVKDYEVTLKRRDGTPVTVSTSSHYYYDEKGNIAGVEGIFVDITERKKVEENLRKSQKEFAGLFTSSPEALVYTDEKSNILNINPRFTDLFGYTLEEVKGRNINDGMIHPTDKIEEGRGFSKKALKEKYYYETIRKKKDGTLFPVAISSSNVIVIDGQKKGIIGTYVDISERKQNEKLQQVLYNISKAANSPISIGQLYPIIHKELGNIIDTTNFFIALVDENKDELYFPYYIDEKDEKMPILKFGITNTLTTYVIKTGKSLLNNNEQYKEMINQGILTPMGSTTDESIWLGVPLKIEGKIMGAMAVQSYTNPNLYSEEDIKLMEFVSNQIATAIERKRMEEELKKLAHFDVLTGSCSRGYGLKLLEQQIKTAKRNKTPILLLYLDVDNIKYINDTFGHQEGDKALEEAVKLFKSTQREADIICRLGGDEFLLIFPESSPDDVPLIKERLNKNLVKLNQKLAKPYKIGFSIGLSYYNPANPLSIDELIHRADKNMYKEKKSKNKRR